MRTTIRGKGRPREGIVNYKKPHLRRKTRGAQSFVMDGQRRGAGPSFWLLVPRGTMFVKAVDTTLTLEVKDAIQFF
jgi:hypothetical protein